MGKNVRNNYLMGLIFWKCWRVALKKFKIIYGDKDFSKKVSKVTVSGCILEPKFEIFFI